MKHGRLILGVFMLFFLLASINAAVDTVIIQYNHQNYDYAVINRTYDLFVGGTGLQNITSSQLTLISNDGSIAQYTFAPGNVAGIRTFNDGINSFNVNVLSEADELADSIGSVAIEITDHSSSVKINNLNLSHRIIRVINLSKISELKSISGNLDLSNILKGLDFNLDFTNGSRYPAYNSLSIDGGSSAGTVINAVLTFNDIDCNGFICNSNDINANPEKLNEVIDKYDANAEYMANATAIKQGNDFSFYTDEGYSDLNGTNLENAQEIINEKIKFIDPDEVIDVLLPIKDFSEFKQFVDFDISVDFDNLTMEDGTYALKVLYEDKYGNEGEMPFTVILDITNTISSELEVNGTVTFANVVSSQTTLQRVENLPAGIALTTTSFGNSKPSTFISIPSNVDALNYIQIDSSNPSATSSGAFDLYFKILKTSIPSSDKNDVRLYVQEGNSWTQLPTTLINETPTEYEYKAVIPHFSNFLIGVLQPSSGGGGGSSSTIYEFGKNVNNNQTNNTASNPINLGGTPPEAAPPGFFATITGAIIGALGTGGTIFVVVFIVGIVGAMIILRVGRKTNKKGKDKKLNDRGDKVDEL
jgi:PGF-pre-PGF domain-containing protein